MTPNQSVLGTAFIKLAMALTTCSYEDNFTRFHGEMLFSSRVSQFLEPIFYVYKLNGSLWIVTRGSLGIVDYLTCACFNEIDTSYGKIHEGFYKAARFVMSNAEPFIRAHKGPVYFTGHSYGGAVSPIAYIMFQSKYPDRESASVGFAPIPMIETNLSTKYFDRIISVVNHKDIVPTLSVENIYERLKLFVPIIQLVSKDAITEKLLEFLGYFKSMSLIDDNTYNMMKTIIPEIDDAVFGYCQGTEVRYIRFPPGRTYQVHKNDPKPFSQCEVNATEVFNILSIYPLAAFEHPYDKYQEAIDVISDDDFVNFD